MLRKLRKLFVKRVPGEANAVDLCVGRFRFAFRRGKYIGWYNAKLSRVLN